MINNFSQVEQTFTSMLEAYSNIEDVNYDEWHAFVKFKGNKEPIKMRKDVFKLIERLVGNL